ncbi:MAG: enoyl-CoA hydratase-related protein [Actinomycetota bacterium]
MERGGAEMAEPAPHLHYEVSGGVAILRLNRPERHNALSPEMVVRLAEAWTEVRDNADVRVALLEGAAAARSAPVPTWPDSSPSSPEPGSRTTSGMSGFWPTARS